ncbi:hypothetical protein NE237_030259 [Protea cynaroides]|uniref:Uncharacterized protein n=1 Tax=Protea cynaroides TaxID=273540 RepID=A0A9Q0GWV6_9MAGN|nr:hypothetical protein NE237_030259 [Protea cynaroides]
MAAFPFVLSVLKPRGTRLSLFCAGKRNPSYLCKPLRRRFLRQLTKTSISASSTSAIYQAHSQQSESKTETFTPTFQQAIQRLQCPRVADPARKRDQKRKKRNGSRELDGEIKRRKEEGSASNQVEKVLGAWGLGWEVWMDGMVWRSHNSPTFSRTEDPPQCCAVIRVDAVVKGFEQNLTQLLNCESC